jgi:two-component system, cell cycle response regulator
MSYRVALCGLTTRDERLIEIVVSRAPNPKFKFILGKASGLRAAEIVVIDDASAQSSESELAELKSANPKLIVVTISDTGLVGAPGYCIERKSLLLRICRMLDSAVEMELLKSPKRSPQISTAAAAADAPAIAGAPPEVAPEPLQPIRALVVDDSLPVREQLTSALARLQLKADMAENAVEALEKLKSTNYDLVFLDVVMPGADGYEVCRNIKKNIYTRSTPVIMLTSRSSPFDRARGALAGCDSYLVKPISWETFFLAVEKTLLKQARNNRDLLLARGYRPAKAG